MMLAGPAGAKAPPAGADGLIIEHGFGAGQGARVMGHGGGVAPRQ